MVVTETKWRIAAAPEGMMYRGLNRPRNKRYIARPRAIEAKVLVVAKDGCDRLATDQDIAG